MLQINRQGQANDSNDIVPFQLMTFWMVYRTSGSLMSAITLSEFHFLVQ